MILSKRKLGVYRFCLNLDITNLVKIKMIKNIKLEVALLSDINGIVALQELYLVSNLSERKKKNCHHCPTFTVPQLAVIIEQAGLFIARTTIESSRTSLPEVGISLVNGLFLITSRHSSPT
jgi:hypothetical protein